MKKFLLLFCLLPSLLFAADSPHIHLTWNDNSTNEDGFEIQRSLGFGGGWLTLFITARNVTSYDDFAIFEDTRHSYRARAVNSNGQSNWSNTAVVTTTVFPNPPDGSPTSFDANLVMGGRLTNLSSRGLTSYDGQVLIVSFSVADGDTKVLIRAVGPTIGQPPFNVPGVVADPKIELKLGDGTIIASNDNWSGQETIDATTSSGAFALPAGSKDAALVMVLAPGNYHAHVTNSDGTAGQVLIEVYEVQ